MIGTGHLLLRPWREGDRPAFRALANTPARMEHFGGVAPEARLDALVDAQITGQAAHGHCFWAVEAKQDGALIGMCGLRIGGHPGTGVARELEIGWRIAEAHWGRGYAREAAQASIEWGWAHTAASRIAAWTGAANRRSWGLMERLGMARRPDLDFDHPRFPVGDPVGRMLVYVVERA